MNYVRKTYSQIRMQHLIQLFLQLIFPMTMHIDKFKCFKYEATHTPKYTDMHHIIFYIYTFFVILNENKDMFIRRSTMFIFLWMYEFNTNVAVMIYQLVNFRKSGSRERRMIYTMTLVHGLKYLYLWCYETATYNDCSLMALPIPTIMCSLSNHAPAFYRARWLVNVTRHV